jgi:hypothetical protein
MRRNLPRGIAPRLMALAALAACLTYSADLRAEFRLFPKRKVEPASSQQEVQQPIQQASHSYSGSGACGCRGLCAKHSWAPYYCGLESYHRPYYGEPGWRGFWKAEKCGIGRKYDMSVYNCPHCNSW